MTAPIASTAGWHLYPKPARRGWSNYLLISRTGRRYQLGHNGKRFAKNLDYYELNNQRPHIIE
jgi:hypothetical protein